jgi:hypothetical protein
VPPDRRAAGQFADGRELRLKFRLPLYRREYFELQALVDRVEPSAGGSRSACASPNGRRGSRGDRELRRRHERAAEGRARRV